MNFSWLSGGDERRMRDPGDGSSLLLTHHREVHRLQSLSMKPNRHYCFNYPALSSIPLSIKKGWAMWSAKGGEGRGGGEGGWFHEFHLFSCPPTHKERKWCNHDRTENTSRPPRQACFGPQRFPNSHLDPNSLMKWKTAAAPLIQGCIIYLSMISL